MKFPVLKFSKNQVNKAGEILVESEPSADDLLWAQTVLTNWRACHGYPINTFQATLRNRLKRIVQGSIVAQRLKRTPSIINKLKRFDSMKLSRMQDIGGLRAIVPFPAQVKKIFNHYKVKGRFTHELISTKDYISEPKSDGYRSVHLVFRYRNKLVPEYDGLNIELQLRSKLQHAWATAVETMGTFLRQALKARQGDRQWLEFFEIVGSAFAHLEKTPLVSGYEKLTKQETFALVARKESELGVLVKLKGFAVVVQIISSNKQKGTYHLVILNYEKHTVLVNPYPLDQLDKATKDYLEAEVRAERGEPIEVVLVSAGPIESLKRAYPNYFLDSHEFIKQVECIIDFHSSLT